MRQVHHIMGMPISLDLRDPGKQAIAAVGEVFAWLREADRRFSPYQPDSEVSALARGVPAGRWVSQDLVAVMELCAHYELISGGAFTAWLPGKPFDPSGIVKGWAVQRAGDILRAAGASRFCLNAGGDVLAMGGPEPGRAWRVGIRHPTLADRLCAVFLVSDTAVATSGQYERGAHIADGRTGRAPSGLLSLTVVAKDLTTADAVATAGFAMGRAGIEWARAQPGCRVFAVDEDYRAYRSPGLVNRLTDRGPAPVQEISEM